MARTLFNKTGTLFLLVIFLTILSPRAHSLTIPSDAIRGGFINLGAEKITLSKKEGILVASGDVHLTYEGRSIQAGKLVYHYQQGILEISDGVKLNDGEVEFSFSRVVVHINEKRSLFFDGFIYVKKEHLFVTAKKFEEVSKDRFNVWDARFTTCDSCDIPDWRIRIKKGKLTLGGYATGSSIFLDIKNRSYIWLPYAFFPAKTERESGILVPKLTSSATKGTRLQVPLYFVTSTYSDLTLTFDYMSKRGLKPEGDFRYRLTELSKGVLSGAYINDKKFKDKRFRLRHESNVTGSFPFFATTSIDYSSDKDYFVDFEDDILLRTARQVFSDLSAGYEGKRYVFNVSGTYIRDIQEVLPDRTAVQIVPALVLKFKENKLFSHLYSSGELDAKNFYTSRDGSNHKGIGTLSLSLPIPFWDSLLFLGRSDFIDNFYFYERRIKTGRGAKNFIYWDMKGTLKTALVRQYPSGVNKLIHRVEPYFTLQQTKRIYGKSPVNFEAIDRAPDKTRMIVGIGNFLHTVDKDGTAMETGEVQVKYSFDLHRNVGKSSNLLDPFSDYFRSFQDQIDIAVDGTLSEDLRSDLYLDGFLNMGAYWKINMEGFYDTKRGRVDKFSLGAKYDNKKESYISASLRHTRTLATDLNVNYNHRLFRWLRLKGWVNYSLKDSVVIENTSFFEFIPKSECWSASFGVSRKTRPAETVYSLYFSLRGLGSIGR